MMETIHREQVDFRILILRGRQVLLDYDLAEMYQVETRVLNQAAKRNTDRFPESFRFQLTRKELEDLRNWIRTGHPPEVSTSQFVILNSVNPKQGENIKHLPYAYTEQGVAMLSAVLRSSVAVRISIQIMEAFVRTRRLFADHALMSQRLDRMEFRQCQTEKRIREIFNTLDGNRIEKDSGIFFNGQIFDAYLFVVKIIQSAKGSIVLIDNYIDESVLTLLSKRNSKTDAIIYTREISKVLSLDLARHNAQYPPVEIRTFSRSHDRFVIIDKMELFHLGASLKDLGKKWFGFSRMSQELLSEVLAKLPE